MGAGLIVLCFAAMGGFFTPSGGEPETREVLIRARKYGFEPNRLVVNRGDRIILRLAAEDVVHGVYIEGYDIEAVVFPGKLTFNIRHPSEGDEYEPVEEIQFVAAKRGKFRFRCSVTCGSLHPFMQGELVVLPNYPLWIGLAAVPGFLLAAIFLVFRNEKANSSENLPLRRVDLLRRVPVLDWLVRRPWLQFSLLAPAIAFLLLFLIAGIWGSPIGCRNIIVTFVWILWWFLLITLLLPFGSRIWCLACPFPFFGEWFQRRRLLTVREDVTRIWKGFKHWPRRLSNIWLQNILFLGLCTFSAMLVTRPMLNAVVLSLFVAGATVIAVLYRYRSFCNYVCPVSGFLSLYSMASIVEIRSRDASQCDTCRTKTCRTGSENGWGCPWAQTPGLLDRNNYCGMCMECIKTCRDGNMTLKARPFFSDIHLRGYDEAWKAFIMISLALVYSVILLGPWGTVKNWANISEAGDWAGFLFYAGTVWVGAMVVFPGVWFLNAWLGKKLSGTGEISGRILFLHYAYLLVPLGLCAWIAFSFPLVAINFTHILATASDPLGWGWDLLGTARIEWRPVLPEYMIFIQIPVMLAGLAYALKRGNTLALELYGQRNRAFRSLLPTVITCAAIAAAFIFLFAR